MREILFEGKRTDNNEWIRGNLVHTQKRGLDYYEIITLDGTQSATVKTETVREFTGLTDKNWKMIFEGDILKIISSVKGEIIDNTRAFKSVEREDCAVVLWDCKTGGYKLKVYHKGKYKRISKFAIGHLFVYKAEVIGNCWDNPELLQEVK